jgi:hypothetical protein
MAASPRTRTGSSPVQTHPVYQTWEAHWRKLVHVYDGSGGFLDGTYLVAHPREWEDFTSPTPRKPTKKLKARRALARYENVAGVLLDQKRSALFREGITRQVGKSDKPSEHPIEVWWKNVDGEGCSIDDWMSDAFTWSALFGHVFHYMDRQASEGAETAADAGALFLRLYCPLDVPDWLQDDRGKLLAVKLLEAVPRTTIDDMAASENQFRERIVTAEAWETRAYGRGDVTAEGPFPHQFGTIPVVVQYAKRKSLAPLVGQSVLGDPSLYIDLYNITSEIRELLRNQTFGILTIKLGVGEGSMNVTDAKTLLGETKGVENVMFTPDGAEYIQPDAANVTVYQAERTELLRTIYRLAALPWESDSKDAEAEGSLKLKREDMNQVLAAYGDQCEKAEIEIAKLWFRANYGDTWEKQWDDAEVVIRYPDAFDVTPFEEILQQVQAATTLPMGPTFMAQMCKRMIVKFMPDLPSDVKSKIEAEIDTQAKAQAEMDAKMKAAELKSMSEPKGGFGE